MPETTKPFSSLAFWSFGFASCFDIRISDFTIGVSYHTSPAQRLEFVRTHAHLSDVDLFVVFAEQGRAAAHCGNGRLVTGEKQRSRIADARPQLRVLYIDP